MSCDQNPSALDQLAAVWRMALLPNLRPPEMTGITPITEAPDASLDALPAMSAFIRADEAKRRIARGRFMTMQANPSMTWDQFWARHLERLAIEAEESMPTLQDEERDEDEKQRRAYEAMKAAKEEARKAELFAQSMWPPTNDPYGGQSFGLIPPPLPGVNTVIWPDMLRAILELPAREFVPLYNELCRFVKNGE